jgi:hypothetical protein
MNKNCGVWDQTPEENIFVDKMEQEDGKQYAMNGSAVSTFHLILW